MGNFSFQTGNIGWIINEDDDEREREREKNIRKFREQERSVKNT